MKRLLYLVLIAILPLQLLAQQDHEAISGKIKDSNGEALPGITVVLEGTQKGDATDISGAFSIKNIPAGEYKLKISGIGYIAQSITIQHPSTNPLEISLEEEKLLLQNVVVSANRQNASIRAKGLNVSLIGADQFQDLNMDVNQIIDISSGVNLREAGGLGSSFDLSLNGLSGNQVRYFVDGVPMAFFGSALSLNNLPANMIRSIEVYKGVVPVELASDALGGSINVRTPDLREEFLDLSYSFGSFNTHRASLFGQVSNERGMFLRLSSFFNHSDNDYWMDNVPVADKFGNITDSERVRRFNDEYTSKSVNLKVGVLDKKLADELSFDLTYADNQNNIQHPDVSINRVFGGLSSHSASYLGSVRYKKSWDKLSISANALAGQVEQIIYDTLSRRYNWEQEYNDLSSNNSGEYYEQRSIFHINDQLARGNVNIAYHLQPGHQLHANVAHNQLKRNGYDEINENNHAFTFPNKLNKNIIALSYEYVSKNEKFQSALFGKQYFFNAVINAEEYVEGNYQNVETTADLAKSGYGASARYTFNPTWTMRFSYEKAYRLPEADEILGDGMFINPNPSLTAENSHNINYGLDFDKNIRNTRIHSEANFFFRPAEDFIRYINDRGIFGSYYNVANVRILGLESSSLVKIRNKYIFGLNWTYQSITDRTSFYEGLPNTNYGRKIPNTPYFFWNVRAGYNVELAADARLSFNWTSRYVHEFFLYWEHLGYQDQKNKIPTQFTHDLDINYSFRKGKYNASLAVRNLADSNIYDNFNIQKPGRAFYLKLRYYINHN